MIAQMSKKSKIYHRLECRCISRIKEESLITFDFDDERIKKLKPCKCCCTLKSIYKNSKKNLEAVFAGVSFFAEFDGEYVRVHTDENDWRIGLSSQQNILLFREVRDEESHHVSLERCMNLKSSKNMDSAMRYIAKEERLAGYPMMYRKQARQIERYAEEKGLQIEFDNTDLYIITDMAAWKITYRYHNDWYKLLHCPFVGQALTLEEAKTARYHIQADVPRTQLPYTHLRYIVEHDAAKKVEQISYKNLPQKTKKQKKYYKQAEKRDRIKSINRVFDLFAELERKRAHHCPVMSYDRAMASG